MQRFALALLSLIVAAPSSAQWRGPEPLDPRDVSSRSGRAVLHVDPSHRLGAGGADYRLTVDGKVAWEGSQAYTLYEVAVADSGTVVGVAYTDGFRDFPKDGRMEVVVLDATGEELYHDAVDQAPHEMHAPAKPLSRGVVIVEERSVAIVRVYDPKRDRREQWQVLDLATGQPGDVFFPREKLGLPSDGYHLRELEPIDGTPLVVMRWTYLDYPKEGPRFDVLDESWRSVWSRTYPKGFVGKDKKETNRIDALERRNGTILGAPDGHVALRLYSDGADVTYRVERDRDGESGWRLTESARVPYAVPGSLVAWRVGEPNSEPEPEPELELELELLGRSQLTTRTDQRDDALVDWLVLDDGRVEALWRAEGERSWTLLDADGNVVEEQHFDLSQQLDGMWSVARLTDGRWVAALDPFDREAQPCALFLDPRDGSVTRIEGYEEPDTEAVTGTADGGFCALTRRSSVVRFDALGKRAWRHKAFSPEALAETSKGEVWVLDVIRHTIEVLSAKGKLLRTFELDELAGQEMNYPVGLAADRDGGVLLFDFNGAPSLWRVNAEGRMSPVPELRRADGHAPKEFLRRARFGPKNQLWSASAGAFYRFHAGGVEDLAVGAAPTGGALTRIDAIGVGPDGWLYALDGGSRTLHVLTPEGERLEVIQCPPGMMSDPPRFESIVFDAGGAAWVPGSGDCGFGACTWIVFGTNGDIREEPLTTGDIAFSLDGSIRWEEGYSEVRRVEIESGTVHSFSQMPSRRWISGASLYADLWGRCTIVSRGESAVYSPSGGVLHTFSGGVGALSENWCVRGTRTGAHAVRLSDGATFRLDLTPRQGGWTEYLAPPDTDQLWVFEAHDDTIELARYRVPRELR